MSLTISAGQVAAFIANPTNFAGYSAGGYVKVDGAIDHSVASQLNSISATYIEASILETTVANLLAIAVNNPTRNTLNKFSFAVSETGATAAELNSIAAKTSVAPDFSKITTIEASDAAAIKTLYTSTATGLGSEAITVNDTAINAKDLNTINGYTDKTVTPTATSIIGEVADVKSLLDTLVAQVELNPSQLGITLTTWDHDANGGTAAVKATTLPITITDATVDATKLLAVINHQAHNNVVTVGSSASTLKGAAATIGNIYLAGASKVAGLGALNLETTDASLTVAQANGLDGSTTGAVTATLSSGVFSGNPNNGDLNLTNLTGTGHKYTITITDTDATAAELKALDAVTTEQITVTNFGTGIGASTAADVIDVLNSAGFTGFPSDLDVDSSVGATSVSQANIIDAKTTGAVTATIAVGDMASLNTLTGTGNAYSITVTDASVLASDIKALDLKTSVAVNLDNVQTITGSLADIKAVYTADDANTLVITTENETINITDTTIAAADLTAIRADASGGTAGTVNLLNVNTITGTTTEVKAALTGYANVVGMPANVAVTITGEGAINAELLNDVDGLTTGLVTVDSTATGLAGSQAEVTAALKASKLVADATADTTGVESVTIVGLTGIDLDISGTITTVAAADAISTNYNVGKVEVDIVLAAPADVATFITPTHANYIKPGSAYTIKKVQGTADAKATFDTDNLNELITLAGNTSGNIHLIDADANAATFPKLKGTISQLTTVFGNTRIKDIGSSVADIQIASGSIAQAADLKLINSKTDKLVRLSGGTGVTISGGAEDVKDVLLAKGADTASLDKIFLGNATVANNIIISENETPVAELDLIVNKTGNYAALTSGLITVVSPTISGVLTDVTAYLTKASTDAAATNKWSGHEDVNINASPKKLTDGTLAIANNNANTFANVKLAEAKTTGVITATMKGDQGLAELTAAALRNTEATTRHNLSFAVQDNETVQTAAALKAADAITGNGTLDATHVASITGTTADLVDVYTSSDISNLGNESVVVSNNATVTQLNTILSKTTAPVTASITASMADLNSLTETGNNLNISVSGNYTTAELTALQAKTVGTVTTNAGTTLTGTYADVTAAIAAAGAGWNTNTNVTVTDAIEVSKARALQNSVPLGVITATITTTDATALVDATNGIKAKTPKDAFTITVAKTAPAVSTDNAVDAATKAAVTVANLATLEARTTEVLNVTSGELRGAVADIVTLFNKNTPDDSTVAATVSGLETIAVTTSDDVSDVQLNKITSKTTGLVTSTTAETLTIDKFVNATTGALLIESGNAITIDLDGNAKVSELITLDAATTKVVNLVDAQNTLTGSIAEIKTLYATADTTTGVATGAHTITGIGNAHLTLTDTGTVQASDIIAIDKLTTGNISIPNTVAAIEGTFADVDKVVAMDAGTGIATGTLVNRSPHGGTPPDYIAVAVNITDPVTVAQANKVLVAMTKGVVTATISDGDIATLITTVDNTQTGLNFTTGGAVATNGHKLAINLTESTVTDAQLKELATRTAGTVTVSSSTTLTGNFTTPGDLDIVLADTTITGITNITSTAAASVDQANNIIGKTSGVVTVTVNQKGIADLNRLTGSGNALTVTLNTPSVDAAALNALNNKTTVPVTVEAATEIISGALSDIKATYDANTSGTIVGLGNEVVVINDSGSISAADLNSVNALTTGAIGANAVKTVTGSLSDLLKVYSTSNSAGAIGGLGDEALIVSDTGSVSAADINSLDSATTGSITATSVTKLTGSVTEITAARSAAVLSGLTNVALTGATETFDALNYLASNADLIKAFGNDSSSAITHYLAFGVNESRNLDSFDEKSYLASHSDLLTAFGSDASKATAHYVSNGFSENRAVDTFDELGYVASYKDLITALGDNAAAAVDHYINFGYGENRTATFDASSYLAANADLQAAFGSDQELAKKHYINHGVNENRALA